MEGSSCYINNMDKLKLKAKIKCPKVGKIVRYVVIKKVF